MGKKTEEINILFTTLSTLPYNPTENIYYWKNGKEEKVFCNGISQLEPGAKYFLSNYRIDKIVAVGSEETYTDKDILAIADLKNEFDNSDSQYEDFEKNLDKNQMDKALYVLEYRLSRFLEKGEDNQTAAPLQENQNKPVEFVFIPQEFTKSNISEILNAIRIEGKKICLYIDMQGGNRTSRYVTNAVISMLSYDPKVKTKIEKVIATNWFGPNSENEVVDETNQYMINRLVNGMNEFLYYGKARSLQAYLKSIGVDKEDDERKKVADIMNNIDECLSVCSIDPLIDNIKNLKDSCDNYKSKDDIFGIVVDRVKEDYKKLFDAINGNDFEKKGSSYSTFIVELIKWALDKKFYQQALTIFESKIPYVLVQRKFYYYAKNEEELKSAFNEFIGEYIKTIGTDTKNKKDPVWMFNDVNYWYIKSYCQNLSSKKGKRLDSIIKEYLNIAGLRNNVNHANENKIKSEDIRDKIKCYLKTIESSESNDYIISQECFNNKKNEIYKKLKKEGKPNEN